MNREKLYTLAAYTGVFFILYMLIFSIFVKTPQLSKLPSFIVLVGLAFAVGLLYGLYYVFRKKLKNFSSFLYIFCLILLTFVPRLLWILLVDTAPASDFFLYHDYAVKASQGNFKLYPETYPLFPFKFGYPLMLSLVFRLFGPGLLAAKMLNVFISVGVALLIYWTSKKLFTEGAGRAAGLVFALWPAQIMYNSVLASEHVFMLFFAVSIAVFVKMQFYIGGMKRYLWPVVMGVTLALAHFIRPVSFMLFPVLAVYLFVFVKNTPWKKAVTGKIGMLLMVSIGFVLSMAILNSVVASLTGVSIWKSSSGFSLLVGTNFNSSGLYNSEDEKIIEEFNYDFDKIHKEATRRAIERIKSSPVEFARLAEKKFIIQWADEDFGVYWSVYEFEKGTRIGELVKSRSEKILLFVQLGYIIILLFAAAGLIYSRRGNIYLAAVPLLLFGAFVGAHTLLEVQSRYHYAVIPLMIIVAGYGMDEAFKKIYNGKPLIANKR